MTVKDEPWPSGRPRLSRNSPMPSPRQVAAAAPMLAAIRVGPNRHISGILWQQDLVITSDQALPAQDSYTLVLPSGC